MARMRTGAKASGGRPLDAAPTLRVPCPNCDAAPGERCRMWRKQDGERLYIRGHTNRHHPQRKALAAGERSE